MIEKTLKLKDIVGRARLSPFTAQYVLKHPELLPGMPEGGEQGVHRTFSMEQAYRFALCTLLVQSGVPLRDASKVVHHCFEIEARHNGAKQKGRLPFSAANRLLGWKAIVADGQMLQLKLDGKPIEAGGLSWYQFSFDKMSKSGIRTPIVTTEIDLMRLAEFLDA